MKYLLSLFLCLSICKSAFCDGLILSSLISETSRKLNDTDNVRWSTATLRTRINYAQDKVSDETDCNRYRYFIDTSSSPKVLSFALSTSPKPLKIFRCWYEDSGSTGTYKKLDYTTVERLNIDYDNWENLASGTPLEWYEVKFSTWSTNEMRIGLKPPPDNSNAGSKKLRVDASCVATDLSSGASVPFNDNPRLYTYHYILVYKVVAMCLDDDEKIEKSNRYEAMYEKELSKMKLNLDDNPALDEDGAITPRHR